MGIYSFKKSLLIFLTIRKKNLMALCIFRPSQFRKKLSEWHPPPSPLSRSPRPRRTPPPAPALPRALLPSSTGSRPPKGVPKRTGPVPSLYQITWRKLVAKRRGGPPRQLDRGLLNETRRTRRTRLSPGAAARGGGSERFRFLRGGRLQKLSVV